MKRANVRLLVVLKPGAEPRGIGARMVGAGPAATSPAADAVPAWPTAGFGVPVDPLEHRGRYPFVIRVAGVRSAIQAPIELVDSSRS
jgi:hypothetical protein